jgi:hypothetical protein
VGADRWRQEACQDSAAAVRRMMTSCGGTSDGLIRHVASEGLIRPARTPQGCRPAAPGAKTGPCSVCVGGGGSATTSPGAPSAFPPVLPIAPFNLASGPPRPLPHTRAHLLISPLVLPEPYPTLGHTCRSRLLLPASLMRPKLPSTMPAISDKSVGRMALTLPRLASWSVALPAAALLHLLHLRLFGSAGHGRRAACLAPAGPCCRWPI